MQKTDYVVNGQAVGYEVTSDGYDIYLDNAIWITQHEPYIPYPNLSYEEGCLKQLENLISQTEPEEEAGSDYEARLSALEEENEMLYATLDDILMNVIPSMAGESEVN